MGEKAGGWTTDAVVLPNGEGRLDLLLQRQSKGMNSTPVQCSQYSLSRALTCLGNHQA